MAPRDIKPAKPRKPQRTFHAHETARMDALGGLPLASFGRRALGFCLDFLFMMLAWAPFFLVWSYFVTRYTHGSTHVHLGYREGDGESLLFLVVYFALANYIGNGQTPGKWVARTRAVSLTHERLGLWQSTERALGYGASFLEGGFGFIQYFINRNRQTVHDRIAETIVVDARKRKPAAL